MHRPGLEAPVRSLALDSHIDMYRNGGWLEPGEDTPESGEKTTDLRSIAQAAPTETCARRKTQLQPAVNRRQGTVSRLTPLRGVGACGSALDRPPSPSRIAAAAGRRYVGIREHGRHGTCMVGGCSGVGTGTGTGTGTGDEPVTGGG